MVFKVTNSLTNSTKTEQNQDSLIRYLEEEHNRASNLNYTANIHISNIDKKNQIISVVVTIRKVRKLICLSLRDQHHQQIQ